MSPFSRHTIPHPDDLSTDDEDPNDDSIDPDLRLRTVRTAASTIAESIREEQRIQKRKTKVRKRSLRLFRSRSKEKKKAVEAGEEDDGVGGEGRIAAHEQQGAATAPTPQIVGQRRNIYVNVAPSPAECDSKGEPVVRYERNKVKTTST
jgi:phospholipid-translocating ATPase